MTSKLLLSTALAALLASTAYAQQTQKITKCQDAQGRWHYGDSAAAACNRSKVTVINNQGLRLKEVAAPLTEEELKAREQNKAGAADEKKRVEEQERKDRQLLATYAVEADIFLARDRKIADLEAQIRAANETLATLRAVLNRMQTQSVQEQKSGKASEQTTQNIAKTEAQIAKHEASISERQKEQERIRQHYQADLERYRVLKGAKPTPEEAAKK